MPEQGHLHQLPEANLFEVDTAAISIALDTRIYRRQHRSTVGRIEVGRKRQPLGIRSLRDVQHDRAVSPPRFIRELGEVV